MIFINVKGVINLKNINWNIGINMNDPITAKAFIGSSSVAIFNPNTSINPGPATVVMPLLVNPIKNIKISKVVFVVENIPIILIMKSTIIK